MGCDSSTHQYKKNQVSYRIQDEDTRKREIGALVALNKLSPLKKAYIITYDEEEEVEMPGFTIEVIPVWKWLLMYFPT